jgi:hypothetical protein
MGQPEKRPGPFAQDHTRSPPAKEQREKDYQPEKRDTGPAIKQKPDTPPDADTTGGGVGSQGGM